MIPVAWRTPLLAALAVEAAAGLPAAAATLRAGPGDEAFTLFTACMAMVGLVDMVLLQGWIWAPRLSLPHVLLRCFLVVCAVPLAVLAGAMVVLGGIFTLLALVPGVSEVGVVLCFAVPGGVVGLFAFIADKMDERPGIVHGRRPSHVLAGVAGALVVLGAAALVSWRTASLGYGGFRPLPWPVAALAPAALVLSGGLHHVLLARDGWRAGIAAPNARTVMIRAAAACAACAIVAGAVLALA